jgi:hypothetical protein
MKTLQEAAVAIERALPLCEAVAALPDDLEARRLLSLALAPIADDSFLEPFERASHAVRGLGNFAHIQALLLRNCMVRLDEPDHVIGLMIVSKSRDLLALLPELRKAIARDSA